MSKLIVLRPFACALACALTIASAVASTTNAMAAPTPLTVLTHSSFDLSKDLVAAFEQQNNAKVQFIKGGDAGAMLSKLILAKNSPLADVVYGIDNTLIDRALRANVLMGYKSQAVANIPLRYWLDPQWRLTPVNYGYVALNIDRAWFANNQLALPKSLDDLIKPAYKSLLGTRPLLALAWLFCSPASKPLAKLAI
jgi:thiamine transport system substrate-binding protein